MLPEGSTGVLRFENTGALWSSPAFALPTLWSDAVLWSGSWSWSQAVVSSDGGLSPETAGSELLWPEASSSDVTLWPESTLWSDWAVLSDDYDPTPTDLDSISSVEDP